MKDLGTSLIDTSGRTYIPKAVREKFPKGDIIKYFWDKKKKMFYLIIGNHKFIPNHKYPKT